MWLLFALMSPLFWAVVHVLDAHCVERVFDRPWMGVITSAIASLSIVLVIPLAIPFVSWQTPTLSVLLLAIAAGGLIQLSQGFYFQALEYSEAGIVAAYWNMAPALLPVASFLLLRKVLGGWQYAAIGILLLTSVAFCLVDANLQARWRSFVLMACASCLQVAAILLEKYVFERQAFFSGFIFVTAGVIVLGSAPLLLPRVRATFRNNMDDLRPAVPMILGIEIANLIALFMSQRAVSLGIPSLVAAVESTIPAYTFGLSLVLVLVTKGRVGDSQARERLPLKLLLVGAMVVGVGLLSG